MKTSTQLLLTSLFSCCLITNVPVARADIFQPTAVLPPTSGQYVLPLICLPLGCIQSASISNFLVTSAVISGGNELVSTTATLAGSIFTNNGGSPGTLLGPLSVTGTVDFVYFGRTSLTGLGTFTAEISDFDFMGTFGGQQFAAMQNPNQASTGITSITQPVENGLYDVSSFFNIFAEVSLNNGPFVPGPGRLTTLEATPDPSPALLLFTCLAGLGFWQARRKALQKG